MASVVGSSFGKKVIAILVFKKNISNESDHVNILVVAQQLFTIPWREVAFMSRHDQRSGLSEHGKPLFLFRKLNNTTYHEPN
jgi:hypothetical protein